MNPTYFDFEIDREFTCSTTALFDAWADPMIKAKWFVGPPNWVETHRSLDLREGGVETMAGVIGGTLTTQYTAHFYDVQPNSRIGYSFEVRLGGEIYSISTSVVQFIETSGGAHMRYHEQLAVFSGQSAEEARPNRIAGTGSHFDRLADYFGAVGSNDPHLEPICGAAEIGTGSSAQNA
jgi:uncharacterized protein YndB with AHSA1/START domain